MIISEFIPDQAISKSDQRGGYSKVKSGERNSGSQTSAQIVDRISAKHLQTESTRQKEKALNIGCTAQDSDESTADKSQLLSQVEKKSDGLKCNEVGIFSPMDKSELQLRILLKSSKTIGDKITEQPEFLLERKDPKTIVCSVKQPPKTRQTETSSNQIARSAQEEIKSPPISIRTGKKPLHYHPRVFQSIHHSEANVTQSSPIKKPSTAYLKRTQPSNGNSNLTDAFNPDEKLLFQNKLSPSRTQISSFLLRSISDGSPVRGRTLKILQNSQAIIAERKFQEPINPDLPQSQTLTTPILKKSGILKGPTTPKANKRVSFSGVRRVRYFLSPEKMQWADSGNVMAKTKNSGINESGTNSVTELVRENGSGASENRQNHRIYTGPEANADTGASRTRIETKNGKKSDSA
ncbi:unnamed protein product [Hymenolepis diminuta]|nr:unnamed protein product [Hymenolepis diminuta]